jgi:phospholipid:diacylglycerol acyltransferase
MLGAVKGVPAVLSGEMKDTAQLNRLAVFGLEKFFSREDRAEILRAMPGISSMLPKGGDAVWGNLTWAPDDKPGQNVSYGSFIKFTEGNSTHGHPRQNLTVAGGLEYLLKNSDPWFRKQVLKSYSHGVAHTKKEVEANEKIQSKWVNPLESRLPYAPSMKIYCFYGIGKETERRYSSFSSRQTHIESFTHIIYSYYYQDITSPMSSLNISIDTSVNGDGSVSNLPFRFPSH